ncbi:hypothetical protein CQW23_09765 [Capsicum baccatum]|uniref:Flavodoxin-like domain-containing protein n=1 Tax=Capsicum baccatum TaxID=33114 RepID=A0A2G2WXP8_CAPBA|nr:hypothetical protein CQW23_09765 [Capsicum baccatum]
MVVEEKTKNLLILYASKTGNAIDVVERLAHEAERRGCLILLISINDFDPSSLLEQEIIIFVVSTTGQGDNSDSIKVFWKFLLQWSLTQYWLSRVNYVVFAVVERGLGDDQHPSGYEVVDAFIKCCNLDPESYIRVQPKDKKENDQSYDLRHILIVPVRLKTFIELYFAFPEERDDLYEYNHKEGRTILGVLEDFPSVQMPFECVVSWITPYKRKRIGFFSSWLAKLDPQKRVLILAWFQQGSANKMPSDMLLAFEEIVSKEGEVPKEAVVRWLRALEKAGKYNVEAWS